MNVDISVYVSAGDLVKKIGKIAVKARWTPQES
jgi:hypothetical protein